MEARYYFTDASGKILGPSALDQIREFVDTGHLNPGADACLEGETDWLPLVRILAENPPKDSDTKPPQPASVLEPADPQASPQQITAQAEPPGTASTQPPAVLAAAAGVTLRALLTDMQDRPLLVDIGTGEEIPAGLETIGQDVLAFTLNSDASIHYLPLSRLLRVTEATDTGDLRLIFR
jgi:hypothetical protein